MEDHVHHPDRSAVSQAAELIARFGPFAASEAEVRAGQSRERGNLIDFCRWRQIGRLIDRLAIGSEGATRH